MASNICERCRERLATTTVRRISTGMDPVTQRVCDQCLQEVQASRGNGSGFGLFDDMFGRFFEDAWPRGARLRRTATDGTGRRHAVFQQSDEPAHLKMPAARQSIGATVRSTASTSYTRRWVTTSCATSFSRSTPTPMQSAAARGRDGVGAEEWR